MKEKLIELITEPKIIYEKADIEELADYLLENGVVVPPVTIGQKVYIVEGIVRELYVVGIGHYKDFQNFTAFERYGETLGCGATWGYDSIGKTVFLTREEAEKRVIQNE